MDLFVDDPVSDALAPPWRAARSIESMLFVASGDGAPPRAQLLFRPETVLRVTDARRAVAYEPGRDFIVDADAGALVLPAGSRIPFETPASLAQLALPRDTAHLDELIAFRFRQAEIVYGHAPGQWRGAVPAPAAAELARTMAKLRAGAPFKLLVIGDSIAEGGDASSFMNVAPYLPAFPEQVARALERIHSAAVTIENLAQAGWSSRRGAELAARLRLGTRQPDLVLVGFGMNDVTIGRDDPAEGAAIYAANVASIREAIRLDAPDAEFVLVSSMFGNPAIVNYPAAHYPLYRDALLPLVGPGTALADVTALWQALMARKHPLAMIANGLNHPNDFGHRLMAQAILGLLIAGPA